MSKLLITKTLHNISKRNFSKLSIPTYTASLVSDCRNKVGECPIWDDFSNLVCWLDINGKSFLTFDPKTNKTNEYELPERAGSFALCNIPTEIDTYLFLFDNGPLFYNPFNEKIIGEHIFKFEPDIISRPNDGRTDKLGNFVFGGMEMQSDNNSAKDKPEYLTQIYRINKDLTIDILIKSISITNSICFNSTGDIMYYTDTNNQEGNPRINYINYLDTFAKDYEPIDNLNQNDSRIKKLVEWNPEKEIGVPDGSIVDANDNIWSARLFEGKMIGFNKLGKKIGIVECADQYVSCACIGGENMDTMYMTCIGELDKEKTKRDYGGLYACKTEFKGVKESRFLGVPQEYTY